MLSEAVGCSLTRKPILILMRTIEQDFIWGKTTFNDDNLLAPRFKENAVVTLTVNILLIYILVLRTRAAV